MLSLLDVIGFETGMFTSSPTIDSLPEPPRPDHSGTQGRRPEPLPHKNHKPPLGGWPNYTALARAIAETLGKPGAAGGINQKLTNFWAPGRGRYSKASPGTRRMLESYGVEFDKDGFVKSCANVPFPIQHR